ncbi:unnamed protein product, partial [Closterium sp. Yama58-4]
MALSHYAFSPTMARHSAPPFSGSASAPSQPGSPSLGLHSLRNPNHSAIAISVSRHSRDPQTTFALFVPRVAVTSEHRGRRALVVTAASADSVSGDSEPSRDVPSSSAVRSMNAGHVAADVVRAAEAAVLARRQYHLLCVSNGHGEDTIAVSILREMQALAAQRGMTVRVSGLPLVGMGAPYHRHGIPTIGPAKTMPSGGFIYMDGKQLANDVAAGLLDLTLQQWQVMKRWVEAQSSTAAAILAVGDVFPLALACLASHHSTTLPATAAPTTASAVSRAPALPVAFMGTAKSEFYIRGDDGRLLPSQARTFAERWWHGGGVYHPWERWLMAHACCRLVAVRDRLTAQVLAHNMPLEEASPSASPSSSPGAVQDGSEAGLFRQGKVAYLGNPMMDHMAPSPHLHAFIHTHLRAWLHHHTTHAAHSKGDAHTTSPHGASPSDAACQSSSSSPFRHVFAILPGSRPPELGAPAALEGLQEEGKEGGCGERCSAAAGRSSGGAASSGVGSTGGVRAVVVLVRGGFAECAYEAHGALAMAGTATEQMVGLVKPVFIMPGKGPQFTALFAEAQTRLLGKS